MTAQNPDPYNTPRAALKRLRLVYKRTHEGASDHDFMQWIKSTLAEIRKAENAAMFRTSPREESEGHE